MNDEANVAELNARINELRYTHEHCPGGLPHNHQFTDRVVIYEYSSIIGVGEANSFFAAAIEALKQMEER